MDGRIVLFVAMLNVHDVKDWLDNLC